MRKIKVSGIACFVLATLYTPSVSATGTPEFSISESAVEEYLAEQGRALLSEDGQDQDCPADEDAWISWRDAGIARMLKPKTENEALFLDHEVVVSEAFLSTQFLDRCAAQLQTYDVEDKNFSKFVRALGNNHLKDHKFGFSITDLEYIEAVRHQVDLPDLLKSQEFLQALRRPETYIDAYQMIQAHNSQLPESQQWKVLIYKSRFLGTPDQSDVRGRFFVFLKEDGLEKWIQFGIRAPDELTDIASNNLSIVSIAEANETGQRPTAIIDHWRTYEEDGTISLSTRYEKTGKTENCTICHKTSPLGLRPEAEYIFDDNRRLIENTVNPGSLVSELNNKLWDYGPPYYLGWVDQNAYGPAIGPADRERAVEDIKSCAAPVRLDDASAANVARSMKCSSCHNEDTLGRINYPQTPNTNFSIGQLEKYISEGWMPPRNTLTAPERDALKNCLKNEYYDLATGSGLLVDWLKN